jgi:hypothetical protein
MNTRSVPSAIVTGLVPCQANSSMEP